MNFNGSAYDFFCQRALDQLRVVECSSCRELHIEISPCTPWLRGESGLKDAHIEFRNIRIQRRRFQRSNQNITCFQRIDNAIDP